MKEREHMNIAVFADLHGRLLLAFKLCARWQREMGEKIDLILQAGDLGVFPVQARLDAATIRYAERDPTELGFLQHFTGYDPEVEAVLAETTCPLVFVRGNHEDHGWLDQQELQHPGRAIFPVDHYLRVYCLKTGIPWTFQHHQTQLRVLGIGRIGASSLEHHEPSGKYLQNYERQQLARLDADTPFDVLLTHHSRTNFVVLQRGGSHILATTGLPEIEEWLYQGKPAYHFYGHYGGPPTVRQDLNGVTTSVKLADLHWHWSNMTLEYGSMGMLRWESLEEHTFTVLDDSWLRDYTSSNWESL
jgi:hypothetical protein